MRNLKRYFALLCALVAAFAGVVAHARYCYPPGIDKLSRSDQDVALTVPILESLIVFFVLLHRVSCFCGTRLGVVGRGQELIIGSKIGASYFELVASGGIILVRVGGRLLDSRWTASDIAMIIIGIWLAGTSYRSLVGQKAEQDEQ